MLQLTVLNWTLLTLAIISPGQGLQPEIWISLNKTVCGNLHHAAPLSFPCFSTYEGNPSTANPAACAQIQRNYTSPTFRTESYNGFMYNQDEMCASDPSDQCLLNNALPTDPRAFSNVSCNQGSVSEYYIEVHSVEDIIAALNFSRKTGVRLSIKNSGHDFLGRSSAKGSLALWMRKFGGLSRDPNFVPEGCSGIEGRDSISTGAGVNFDEVYKFADEQGVTFIGAYASTVGVTGGWVQGGGHSVLSPVYGLGIDRVLEFKIVTTDGILRTVNACTNPDLFWALRGGGGGTFGIVVSATHVLEPRMSLSVASIKYPQTIANVNTWLEILVNNSLLWANDGWGGHYLASNLVCVTPLLSLSAAITSMEAASSFALANNGTVIIETLPSWYAFYTKYVIPNTVVVGLPRIPTSRLIPTSVFASEPGRAKLLAFLNHILEVGLSPYIPSTTPFLYPWTPGSTSATPAWRSSVWHLSFGGNWAWNSTVAQRAAVIQLLDQLTEEIEELTPGSGAYLNEDSAWTENWEEDWWGENYERLLEIKRKYDPHGLLSCWKCVGFDEASAEERFPCFAGISNFTSANAEL